MHPTARPCLTLQYKLRDQLYMCVPAHDSTQPAAVPGSTPLYRAGRRALEQRSSEDLLDCIQRHAVRPSQRAPPSHLVLAFGVARRVEVRGRRRQRQALRLSWRIEAAGVLHSEAAPPRRERGLGAAGQRPPAGEVSQDAQRAYTPWSRQDVGGVPGPCLWRIFTGTAARPR